MQQGRWCNFKLWWSSLVNLSGQLAWLRRCIVDHGGQITTLESRAQRIQELHEKIDGFSRDLQIIRDRITREWREDPKASKAIEDIADLREAFQELDERFIVLEERDAALVRIADTLDRAFPVTAPAEPPPPPSPPSDLSNLTTVTSEDADEKARFWRDLARRYGIAPDSDLFQEMILHYETEVAARGFAPQEINWDQVFKEASSDLGAAVEETAEEAGTPDPDGEPTGRS